jgi:hypothetical protein
MSALETNIFPIANLSELTASYRLYRIRGLRPDQPECYQNRQALLRRLSYQLQSPVTVIDREGVPHVAIREDAAEPPSRVPLVRTTAYLERVKGKFRLDFAARSPESDVICLRFLNFMIQPPLYGDRRLWQPASGQPFYRKEPCRKQRGVCQYRGFAVRAVVTPEGGVGLCVDVKHAYASETPLSVRLARREFRRWQGSQCIYHLGHQWYKIRVDDLSDLNVCEELIDRDGCRVSLLEWLADACTKPLPPDLARLPHDAAVVHYRNNRGETRAAPAGLCYPVLATDEPRAQSLQRQTILPPHERRALIHVFVRDHLQNLRFGDVRLRLGQRPVSVRPRMFSVPDLLFGNRRVLSVRGTDGADQVGLDQLGRARLALLRDRNVGFFGQAPLERQFLILPQTVADSWGQAFRRDLARAVDEFFPQETGYSPVLVTYNDRVPRTAVRQGQEILRALEPHRGTPGYALVMIHQANDRRPRGEDQLAALVLRELRRDPFDLPAAVIHSTMGQEAYEHIAQGAGRPRYQARSDCRGRLGGYLRNVALNKVLLTNERWPFVLATPQHADLVVGIDVKHHTAGFTIVGKHGGQVRTLCRRSRQREMLLADQVTTYLLELIRVEAAACNELIRTVVVHRDGRLWPSEREGIHRALERLRAEGVIASDATVTMLEISKSSPVSLRLFDVDDPTAPQPRVLNPQVGAYLLGNDADAYLCATGRAFPRPGTVNPLHVRHAEGPLSLVRCLEDVYALTTLAWTRPEDCTRDPITIKLNDRRLGEDAGEYDADALSFADGGNGGDAA